MKTKVPKAKAVRVATTIKTRDAILKYLESFSTICSANLEPAFPCRIVAAQLCVMRYEDEIQLAYIGNKTTHYKLTPT